MDKIRLGVLGAGNMGTGHIKNTAEGLSPHVVITACADIRPERLEVAKGLVPEIHTFTDGIAMMESGLIDAVLIATPHYLHPFFAKEAFQRGLHVLTEKPAGVQVSEVQKMNAAAKASGLTFGIMFNQRADKLFQKARAIVQSGELGAPKRFVWIITNWYRTQSYYNSGSWRATWSGEGGGVLLNQSPHNLDLWQWIFGMPKRVRAFVNFGKYHDISVEDEATIYAEYENGAVGTFITTTGEAPGTNRLEISGDRGKLVLEHGKLTFTRLPIPEREYCYTSEFGSYKPEATVEEYTFDAPDGHPIVLENFARAVLYGEELLAPGYDGICSLSISNAALLSAWTDSWADIPVDTARFDALLAEHCKNEKPRTEYTESAENTENLAKRWQVQW